jgi:23S rRNA pseudouridine2605 synthase
MAFGRRVQLHRAISKLGWGSRKQAWDWIRAGAVHVDGAVVTDPLTWVDLDRQHITRRDQSTPVVASRTIALHKPSGVVTTRRDEHGRRTIYDLLPSDFPWLHAAGRLDADSEGLLILTNDSALSARLTDPENHIPKTYHVTLDDRPTKESLQRLRQGVELPEGPTRPAQVRLLEEGGRVLEMVLTEGRNRQIRRMAWSLGYRVRRLVRVAIGGLTLGDLAVGEWRDLSDEERRLVIESSDG